MGPPGIKPLDGDATSGLPCGRVDGVSYSICPCNVREYVREEVAEGIEIGSCGNSLSTAGARERGAEVLQSLGANAG